MWLLVGETFMQKEIKRTTHIKGTDLPLLPLHTVAFLHHPVVLITLIIITLLEEKQASSR